MTGLNGKSPQVESTNAPVDPRGAIKTAFAVCVLFVALLMNGALWAVSADVATTNAWIAVFALSIWATLLTAIVIVVLGSA